MNGTPIWARSVQELATALDDRSLTSQEIVAALQQRADAVEPAVSGFALQTREQALRDAEIADDERRAGCAAPSMVCR